MRKIVFAALLAATGGAHAQYTFLLKYPDGSLQICPSTGFTIGFDTINADVTDCKLDKIFGDKFGG